MKKFKFRKFIASILLVCTVLGGISPIEVRADSNKLRETYLQLMSGAAAVDVADIENLTVNDLRVVAAYLSNFYVPYNTALDDKENREANITMMINCLKDLGFKQDAAEVLVNAVFSASLSSASQLYVKGGDLAEAYDEGSVKLYTSSESWWKNVGKAFLTAAGGVSGLVLHILSDDDDGAYVADRNTVFGSGDDQADPAVELKNLKDNSTYIGAVGANVVNEDTYYPVTVWEYTTIMNKTLKDDDSRVRFYFKNNNVMVPCFELNRDSANMIVDMARTVDGSDHSIGNALLNCTYSKFLEMSNTEKYASTSFTQKMYVDWVGNLIADFGDIRVIMYPGCVNPYAFGKITDSAEPTAFTNLVSTWGIHFLQSTNASVSNGVYSVPENNYNPTIGTLRNSAKSESLQSWDTSFGVGKGDGDEVRKFLLELGVFTGVDDDIDTKCEYKSYARDLSSDNALGSYLFYKSIGNNRIETLSSDSAFDTVDFWEDGVDKYFSNTSRFSKKSSDFSSFMQFDSSDKVMLRNFFVTYAFAYNNRNLTSYDEANPGDAYLNMKFNAKNFPESMDTSIVWDSINSDTEKITSLILNLLHPTEGVKYVATWFKNKVGGILVSWHEDIVGGTESNSTTGMTQYLGFTGYVTSPSLKEISWIVNLMDNYDRITVFLIVFMLIILLCFVLTGYMTMYRGIVGLILFAYLAYLPPIAINVVTDFINNICDTIYSDKFDYWSYTQLQTYLSQLSSVKSADSVNDYVAALMNIESSAIESTNGFSGVKVKWMSPKKIHDSRANDEMGSVLQNSFSSTLISVMSGSLSSVNRSEEYVDGVAATYLYRDFMDIFRYGVESYNLFTTYNFDGGLDENIPGAVVAENIKGVSSGVANWSRSKILKSIPYYAYEHTDVNNREKIYLKDYILANVEVGGSNSDYILETSSLNAIRRGFLNDTIGLAAHDESGGGRAKANYYFKSGALAPTFLLNYYQTVCSLESKYDRLKNDLSSSRPTIYTAMMDDERYYYGLTPTTFDYSLYALETDGEKTIEEGGGKEVAPDFEQLSAFYYALYAESPYYYFNYNFRDYVSTDKETNYSYKSNSLDSCYDNIYKIFTRDNQGYFYNLADNAGDGYGELKDFMNFHDLFYYVMPCLDVGNKIADAYDATFGMYVNDDMQLQITPEGKIKFSGKTYNSLQEMGEQKNENGENVFEQMNDEELYKFWHDYNVWSIFQGYVPWLDTMQDCKYAEPEVIEVLGDKFTVENPLDPTSYFAVKGGEIVAGRYMVFSRSEMAYYGLDMTDLTTTASN